MVDVDSVLVDLHREDGRAGSDQDGSSVESVWSSCWSYPPLCGEPEEKQSSYPPHRSPCPRMARNTGDLKCGFRAAVTFKAVAPQRDPADDHSCGPD